MSFDIFDDFIKKDPLFLNESLVTLLIQDRLKENKDMFLLLFGQIANVVSETSFLLLCHWFSVFHCEVGSKVLVKRSSFFIYALDLPFWLQDLVYLLLKGTGQNLLSRWCCFVCWCRSVRVVGSCWRFSEVVNFVFCICYHLWIQFWVLIFNLFDPFFKFYHILTFDS